MDCQPAPRPTPRQPDWKLLHLTHHGMTHPKNPGWCPHAATVQIKTREILVLLYVVRVGARPPLSPLLAVPMCPQVSIMRVMFLCVASWLFSEVRFLVLPSSLPSVYPLLSSDPSWSWYFVIFPVSVSVSPFNKPPRVTELPTDHHPFFPPAPCQSAGAFNVYLPW